MARLTFEHLWLTLSAMLLAVAVGLPLGILLTRKRRAGGPGDRFRECGADCAFAGAVWSTAAGALAGENAARLAILALTGYALLPILRNTYAGICSVDPALVDVSNALGMSGLQRLMKVELPLAASVILAGLRTATVTCIGVGDDCGGNRGGWVGGADLPRSRQCG